MYRLKDLLVGASVDIVWNINFGLDTVCRAPPTVRVRITIAILKPIAIRILLSNRS